jgi:hypothetical protein
MDQPDASDRGARELAEHLRKAAEELRQARVHFVKQQRDSQKRSLEEQRDQIRAKLREDRSASPTLRPEMQRDFDDRITALKEQLRNHGEALDEAKQKAQRVKKRKAGE